MQLTDVELELGRKLIRERKIETFMQWVQDRGILIDQSRLQEILLKVAPVDPDRAVVLFDKVFVGMDPELDRRVFKIRAAITIGITLLILTGCLGGLVYLLQWIVG